MKIFRDVYTPEYTAKLKKAFEMVQDLTDWKAPIDNWIYPCEMDIVKEAIIFYTATCPTFKPQTINGVDKLRVQAIGYRNGPAGP